MLHNFGKNGENTEVLLQNLCIKMQGKKSKIKIKIKKNNNVRLIIIGNDN
jgi:hypothetical protein